MNLMTALNSVIIAVPRFPKHFFVLSAASRQIPSLLSAKAAEPRYSFFATPVGRVLYLCDYSLNYCKGELHEWYGGETRKIDDDVICIIPYTDRENKGSIYLCG